MDPVRVNEETVFLVLWALIALIALLYISLRWPGRISLVWRRVLYAVFLLILIVNAVKAVALLMRAAGALSGVR